VLKTWSLEELWSICDAGTHQVTDRTRAFVSAWRDRTVAVEGRVALDSSSLDLVRARERAVKTTRSRFDDPGRRASWGGAAGTSTLVFRWDRTQVLLADLYAAVLA